MLRRIFIAINIPEDIKRKLAEYQDKWLDLPCKWTKRDNLHLTLCFLGNISDDDLLSVIKTAREIAQKHKIFNIILDKISYGPPGKEVPRMVWVQGEQSEELTALQKDLENALMGEDTAGVETGKPYTPHLTLARIAQWEFQRLELDERPQIDEEILFNVPVESIEVMESELKRGGPKYTILETCELGN